MEGPLQTRILNLGGTGDCAWRVLAFLIAQTHAKWSKNETEIAERSESLGAALRAQAITYLTVKDQTWEESYCEDTKWTPVTEGGKPEKDFQDFKDNVLPRPNRYMCHLGLQAVATIKKINIMIWELLEDDQWAKVALMTPAQYGPKTPTIHLALGGLKAFAVELISLTFCVILGWLINCIGGKISSSICLQVASILGACIALLICAVCRFSNSSIEEESADFEIRCGMDGPLRTKILNLGGTGNCAWRALAFLIAQTNTGWKIDENKFADCLEALGEKLRAQAIIFLRTRDQSWEEFYFEDTRWTLTTEGGRPATDLIDFKGNVLSRPNRHICHLGLQAVAALKRINIVIWKLSENQQWVTVALFSPPELEANVPTVHLALGSDHYFACTKSKGSYPEVLAEIGELQGVYVSHGFHAHVFGSQQNDFNLATFRAAGDNQFSTPKKTRSQSVDSLLRSCRSTSSRKSDLLKTCSSVKSPKQNDGRKFRPYNWINNQLKNDKWKCKSCEYEIKVQSRNDRVAIIRHLTDNHPKEREAQNAALKNHSHERQLKRAEELNKKAEEEEKKGKALGHQPIGIQMNFKRGRTGNFGVICRKCLMMPIQKKSGDWTAECEGIPKETMWGEAQPGSQW
eukprot:s1264_g1.t1